MNEELYKTLVSELCSYYSTISFYRRNNEIVLNMAHFSRRAQGPYHFMKNDTTMYLPFSYKGHLIKEMW